MLVGAKVCDLTEDLLWFVCGLYVGILTFPLTTDVVFVAIVGRDAAFGANKELSDRCDTVAIKFKICPINAAIRS